LRMFFKMDFKLARGVFLVLLAAGFSLFLFVYRPWRTDSLPPQTEAWRQAEEDVHLDGIRFREWQEGNLLWDLEAGTAKYYHHQEEARFDDVSLVFHPPEGHAATVLHADRVVYEMKERLLRAEGNVWGEAEQGVRFSTASLVVDVEAKHAETKDKVVLKKDRLTIEGTGMSGSLQDQTFVLLSSVRSVFLPDEAAP